jgi:hypothetical protein
MTLSPDDQQALADAIESRGRRAVDATLSGADPYAISNFMVRLADSFAAADRVLEERRATRRRTPEARAVRAEAARRGWETRRAQQAEPDDPSPVVTGPTCGEMDHDGIGRETFCDLPPDHDGDCDDLLGHTWNYR